MNKNVDSAKKVDVSKILGKYGVYIALLVLFVVMSFASSSFLTVTNLFNILKQNAVYGVLAVGMTFVIVTGGIDLSRRCNCCIGCLFCDKTGTGWVWSSSYCSYFSWAYYRCCLWCIQWIIYCNSKYPCIYCNISNMYNCPWYCICIYRWTTDYRCF